MKQIKCWFRFITPFSFALFHPKQCVTQLSLLIKFKGSKVALAFRKPTAAPHRALQFWFVLLARVSRCRWYCGLIITLELSWHLPLDSNTLLQKKKVIKSQVPSRILSLFTAATTLGAIWFLNSLTVYEFVNLFNKYLLSIYCLYWIIFLTL